MKTYLSAPAIRLAKAAPGFTKGCLWTAARVFSSRKPHWLLRRIASEIDYRVPVEVRLANGMKIHVVWVDAVGSEICTKGCYEPETFNIVRNILKPGMIFMDVGAQVGQYTLLAAGLGADVHSFEADPETFRILERNVYNNNLNRVYANCCAVNDHGGTVEFFAGTPDNIGSSSLCPSAACSRSYQVQSQSLDEYIHQHRIPRIDLIKIDVEGAELQVLKGGQNALSKPNKPKLIVEFSENNQSAFGASCAQLAKSLTVLGYELFRIEDSGPIPYKAKRDDLEYFNVMATPK